MGTWDGDMPSTLLERPKPPTESLYTGFFEATLDPQPLSPVTHSCWINKTLNWKNNARNRTWKNWALGISGL